MQSTAASCLQPIDCCNDLNESRHVPITQHAPVLRLGLFPQIRFLHQRVNAGQLKRVKLKSVVWSSTVYVSDCKFAQIKSVPTACLPAVFEKVAGRYESLLFLSFSLSFLLSDFNFLSAKSIPLRFAARADFVPSKLIFPSRRRRRRRRHLPGLLPYANSEPA